MYSDDKFCYTAIKVIERQTEGTKEFLKGLFDPEESKIIKRKIGCKVIMYNKYNEHNKYNKNDKCNSNEHNKSNKK